MAHITASFMIITDKRSSAATCWTDDQPLFLQDYQRLCVEWEQQRIQLQKQVAALEVQNKRLNDELTLSSVRAEFLHPAMTATHTPTMGHKWTLCKFYFIFLSLSTFSSGTVGVAEPGAVGAQGKLRGGAASARSAGSGAGPH